MLVIVEGSHSGNAACVARAEFLPKLEGVGHQREEHGQVRRIVPRGEGRFQRARDRPLERRRGRVARRARSEEGRDDADSPSLLLGLRQLVAESGAFLLASE